MASRVAAVALRYPVPTTFTVLTLLALCVTLVFYAVGLPFVTRSIRNFIRLATLTFVLAAFAVGFWVPALFERRGRKDA